MVHRIRDDGEIMEHRAIRYDLALMSQLVAVKSVSAQYDDFLQSCKGAKPKEEKR